MEMVGRRLVICVICLLRILLERLEMPPHLKPSNNFDLGHKREISCCMPAAFSVWWPVALQNPEVL